MSACRSDDCHCGRIPCPTPELCNAADRFDRLVDVVDRFLTNNNPLWTFGVFAAAAAFFYAMSLGLGHLIFWALF